MWRSALPGHKLGPDYPLLSHRVRVSDVRPETPRDPGYITEDVCRFHHKVHLSTII